MHGTLFPLTVQTSCPPIWGKSRDTFPLTDSDTKMLTSEAVDSSLSEAKTFLAEKFPEFDYRGFKCRSWLMDRQLVDLLGEETNISKFCKRFYKISMRSKGRDVFSFVYHIPETQDVCIEALPENTTLERCLKAHFRNGGAIYEVDGFIPKDRV